MNLYLDIGNTYIKFATYTDVWNILRLRTNLSETATTLNVFLKSNFPNIKFDNLIISSVVPEIDLVIKELNQEHLQAKLFFLNANTSCVKINSKVKQTIGADIVASAIYAASLNTNVITIIMGTATVVSYIANQKLVGSIIAPGLWKSYKELTNHAALLNSTVLKQVNKMVGNSTQEALGIGFIDGWVYMLQGFINRIDANATVLLSGGDAHLVASQLKIQSVDDIILKGLKLAYEKSSVSKK